MGTLFLNGVVGYEIVSRKVKEFLENNDSDEITVAINSVGGEVFEGLEIYNILRNSGRKITTVLTGLAASMGSIIFLAGDERIALDGTLFMVHKPSTISWGNADNLRGDASRLDLIQASFEPIYKDRTNIEDVKKAIDDETWYSVDEMEEYGISNSTKKIELFSNPNITENDKEDEEEMGKIEELQAQLDEQKKINAELLEKEEVADLEKQLAEMKAENEKLSAAKDVKEDPQSVDKSEVKDEIAEKNEKESDLSTEANAVVDMKINTEDVVKEKPMQVKNEIPEFMQVKSKY